MKTDITSNIACLLKAAAPYCENGENGLGLWQERVVCTPSENCENGENGLGLWLGCGVCTPSGN